MRWVLIHTFVIILILLLGASPLIVALAAGTIADANGCELHEGFVNPCIINGKDWGQDLYTMGMLGFFAIGTLPIGVGAAGVYLLIVVIIALVRRVRRPKALPAP
ncbi:MAG: hypothetical protein IT328_19420 [Caldilineaceae bacterium]|nr:hypothetical protein [Caldilineaceae bacterium]